MTTGALNAREEVAQRLERLADQIRRSEGNELQFDRIYSDIVKLAYQAQQHLTLLPRAVQGA